MDGLGWQGRRRAPRIRVAARDREIRLPCGHDEAPSTAAGYSIVEAADADAAAALMDGHPHLKLGAIEVLETIELPGR